MKIKIPLESGRKSPPFQVMEVVTDDLKLVTGGIQVELDKETQLPTGLINLIDLYGNDISLHHSKIKYIVAICATEIRTRTNRYFIIHPPHNFVKDGQIQTEVTILQKGGSNWGRCYKYENMFSI